MVLEEAARGSDSV